MNRSSDHFVNYIFCGRFRLDFSDSFYKLKKRGGISYTKKTMVRASLYSGRYRRNCYHPKETTGRVFIFWNFFRLKSPFGRTGWCVSWCLRLFSVAFSDRVDILAGTSKIPSRISMRSQDTRIGYYTPSEASIDLQNHDFGPEKVPINKKTYSKGFSAKSDRILAETTRSRRRLSCL